MFEAADIGDWIGKDVLDLEGAKVGTLESAYFDTATEHPTFGAVQVGMVGCHRLADREADLAMYRAKADGRDRIRSPWERRWIGEQSRFPDPAR